MSHEQKAAALPAEVLDAMELSADPVQLRRYREGSEDMRSRILEMLKIELTYGDTFGGILSHLIGRIERL